MENSKKTFLDYWLTTIKWLSLAWALSSAVLLYQASILQKFEQALNVYNKVEKKDFEKISKNLIDNYELEAAKDLVSYTIFDDKKKEKLLKEISKKEKSSEYKIDSLKKCVSWKSNWSSLSTICNNGIMLTPFWDIVDLIKEWTKDEKIDKVTVWLSVLGLAATAWTIFTWWTAAPLKIGISWLKKLHKLSMLPDWLIKDLSKIRNLDDVKKIDLDLFKKIWVLFEKTDFEIAWKLLKVTKDKESLINLVSLVKKYPTDIKNFMRVSPDSFLKAYNKYGDKFSIDLYKKAFFIKDWFKMLEKWWKKWFLKKITKPKYPWTKIRILKNFEKVFWKITNIVEFIYKLLFSLVGSIWTFFVTDIIQSYVKYKKKKL